MAKIIMFGDFSSKRQEQEFTRKLNEKVEKLEEELGIEDEPLLVLTDDAALNLGNVLLDIKESINSALDILNISESENLPWEE